MKKQIKKKLLKGFLLGTLTVCVLGMCAGCGQKTDSGATSQAVSEQADTKENARILAKSVICSSLTKAAVYGHDANWGRILCALGYSGAQFDPEQVDLFFESCAGKLQIIANGTATDYSEEKATEILSQEKVTAIADLKAGDAEATAWGCDLTHGYIDINADYRS